MDESPRSFDICVLGLNSVCLTPHVVRIHYSRRELLSYRSRRLLASKCDFLTPHVVRKEAHVVSPVNLGFLTRVMLLDSCIFGRS